MGIKPRPIEPGDLRWIHALNRQHEVELSPLGMSSLADLVSRASYGRVVDHQAAFLLAFDQAAAHNSANFLWFRERLTHFLYVDRVAVAHQSRGRGYARALYEDLFAFAGCVGSQSIVCEVNTDPPNPASDAFHAALGFEEAGRAHLTDRRKSVVYLRKRLPAGPA